MKTARLLSALLLSLILLTALVSCGGDSSDGQNDVSFVPYSDELLLASVSLDAYTGLTVKLETADSPKDLALWEELNDRAEILSYPPEQLAYYESEIRKNYRYLAELEGMSYDALLQGLGVTDESIAADAREAVKSDLVWRYIALDAEISLTDSEIETLFDRYAQKIAEDYGYTREYATEHLRDLILETMLRDKTTQYLLQRNSFTAD